MMLATSITWNQGSVGTLSAGVRPGEPPYSVWDQRPYHATHMRPKQVKVWMTMRLDDILLGLTDVSDDILAASTWLGERLLRHGHPSIYWQSHCLGPRGSCTDCALVREVGTEIAETGGAKVEAIPIGSDVFVEEAAFCHDAEGGCHAC